MRSALRHFGPWPNILATHPRPWSCCWRAPPRPGRGRLPRRARGAGRALPGRARDAGAAAGARRRGPGWQARGYVLDLLAEHFWEAPATLELLLARAAEDPDWQARRYALDLLAEHFWEAPATLALLLARAAEDPDWQARRFAFGLLAEHFWEAPATLQLLRARAAEDSDGETRGYAMMLVASAEDDRESAVLLSRDLDAGGLGIDADAPIDRDRVRAAAAKLGRAEDEVRAAYERLAGRFPLKLEWQRKQPRRDRSKARRSPRRPRRTKVATDRPAAVDIRTISPITTTPCPRRDPSRPRLTVRQRWLAARRLAAGRHAAGRRRLRGAEVEDLEALAATDPRFMALLDDARALRALSREQWRERVEGLLRDHVEDAIAEGRVTTINLGLKGLRLLEDEPEEYDPDAEAEGLLARLTPEERDEYDCWAAEGELISRGYKVERPPTPDDYGTFGKGLSRSDVVTPMRRRAEPAEVAESGSATPSPRPSPIADATGEGVGIPSPAAGGRGMG